MARYRDIHPMMLVSSSSSSRVNGGLTAGQLGVVLTCVEARLTEPVALAELAQLIHLSPSHLCRVFRRSVGVPPKRYRRRLRMELAKTLLAARASVTEVGLVLGYSETSAFSTAFHKTTGVTPTAYRRSLPNASPGAEEEP